VIEAAERDSIARQYATEYRDVFAIGLRTLRMARAQGRSEESATQAVYLELLAQLPDSLIARKFGWEIANRVSGQAAEFNRLLRAAPDAPETDSRLTAWDRELKHAGINPGTTADLTVASLLAARLEDLD
jgi:triphosphoribosyl-dephospho-CoA synthase